MVNSNKFLPDEHDVSDIFESDVVKKLPCPCTAGASERQLAQIYFPVDFATYTM